MAGSVQVTISGLQDTAGLSQGSLAGRDEIQQLQNLLRAIQNGATPAASLVVSTGTANAVRATGTLTISSGSGTVGASSIGGTSKTVTWATSDTATATALTTAINADTTLNKFVTATSAAGVVTITAHVPGDTGNKIALVATGTGVTASGATLGAGAGVDGAGSFGSPTTYSF